MRKKSTFLALSACIAFIVFTLPAAAQNQAFKFNDNTYVVSSVDVVSSEDFTVEFWAYVDGSAMDSHWHQFVSQGVSDGSAGFYIGYDGTDSTILAGDLWNFAGPSTGVKMPVNQWTHIAFTYNNSSNIATLYLNGVVRASAFYFWLQLEKFRIGARVLNSVQTDFLKATKVDQLKVWNKERPAYTIKQDMFGAADVNDATLTTLYNFTYNGSLTMINQSTGPEGGSGQDGTIIGDTVGSWVPSPIQSNTNGLTFNGTENDQIVIPDSVAYDQIFNSQTGTGGTIEFYVNPSSLSGTFSTVLGKYGHYSFLLSTTQIGISNGTTTYTLDIPLSDFPLGFPTGQWSHLAFVYNGDNSIIVYYNGYPLGSPITGNFGSAPIDPHPITLGVSKTTAGSDTLAFTGGIDEVRIWSTQRQAADIFTNVDNSLNGLDAGLISQFTFDQGVPDEDNTGMTVAFDNVAGNHGQLTNFQLTGTTSNFNLHPMTVIPVPLPITLTKFTAQRLGTQALLQWQTAEEQNSRDFTIERSTDGKNYSAIGIVRAAGTSNKPLDYTFTDLTPARTGNYYRLRESDLDSKYTYSPIRLLNFGTLGRLSWYATGKLSAEVSLQQGNNENYSVTDAGGRMLRQGQLSSGKTTISGLPAGVYFVRVITSGGSILISRVLIF